MSLQINERCTSCAACVQLCPTSAILPVEGGPYRIDRALCIECRACGRVCTADAVTDLSGTVIPTVARRDWLIPHFLIDRCLSCEECVQTCPVSILVMKDDEYHQRLIPALAFPKSCISCWWCVEACQFDAITMHKLVL